MHSLVCGTWQEPAEWDRRLLSTWENDVLEAKNKVLRRFLWMGKGSFCELVKDLLKYELLLDWWWCYILINPLFIRTYLENAFHTPNLPNLIAQSNLSWINSEYLYQPIIGQNCLTQSPFYNKVLRITCNLLHICIQKSAGNAVPAGHPLFVLMIVGCLIDQGKDQNSEFGIRFLLSSCWFCTIAKSNCWWKYCKCGTHLCIVSDPSFHRRGYNYLTHEKIKGLGLREKSSLHIRWKQCENVANHV